MNTQKFPFNIEHPKHAATYLASPSPVGVKEEAEPFLANPWNYEKEYMEN